MKTLKFKGFKLVQKKSGFYTESGIFFGKLCGSVGPHGKSTGEFTRCLTTTPMNELGVTHVGGKPVLPHE